MESDVIAELSSELAEMSRDEIIVLLAEANVRASEAEQFLNYAPQAEIDLHRRRVVAAQRSPVVWRDWPQIPMPRIEHGRSVWNQPHHLLTGDEARDLPVGSRVHWIGDGREGGLRRRASDGWRPLLSMTDFYWLIWKPNR